MLTSLLPFVNEKAVKVNATYKQPNMHTVTTLDVFKVKKNILINVLSHLCYLCYLYVQKNFNVNTVFGRDGFLIGGEAAYSVKEGKVSFFFFT